MRNKEKNSGITLIALVVTIIVLLILAGISLAMLTGPNGLISKATQAGKESIIGEEKEEISLAVSEIRMEKTKKFDSTAITAEELQNVLIKNTKKNIEVTGTGILSVEYVDTQHTYEIDNSGNINVAATLPKVNDPTPGEFDKEGDGTEANPYKIKSIEDLVGLSKKCNEEEDSLDGVYFELDTDLDFKSPKSYVDATRTDMGDINENGEVEELIIELTTGYGFDPIGSSYSIWDGENWISKGTYFGGIFDGKGHTINNLHEGYKEWYWGIGFFGDIDANAEIKNLNLKNIDIRSDSINSSQVGGLAGSTDQMGCEGIVKITNCIVSGKIDVGGVKIGGIIGMADGYALQMRDCVNYCTIESPGELLGGLIGEFCSEHASLISNCKNYGRIVNLDSRYSGDKVGGLYGYGWNYYETTYVEECLNYGDIVIESRRWVSEIGGLVGDGYDAVFSNCANYGNIKILNFDGFERENGIGGIIGWASGDKVIVKNCINYGIVSAINCGCVGGIVGACGWRVMRGGSFLIKNCYNIGEIEGKEKVGGISGINAYEGGIGKIQNSYNVGKVMGENKIGGIAGILVTETNSEINNSYYLGSCCDIAYTEEKDEGNEEVTTGAKTEEEMKTQEFVDLLNTDNDEPVWKKDENNKNNGYPIL